MKAIRLLITVFSLGLTASLTHAQNGMDARIGAGWLFPYGDMTDHEFMDYRPNVGLNLGFGYTFNEYFSLRGNALTGIMNGSYENVRSFETFLFEPSLLVDLNVMPLLNKDSKWKLQAYGGPGWAMINSSARTPFQGEVARVPADPEKNFSHSAVIVYGGNIGIPIGDKLDLNLGFSNRYLHDTEWLDATESGEATDHYGYAEVGLTFHLREIIKEDEVKMKKDKYNDILTQRDKYKEEKETEVAQKDMEIEEKNVEIAALREEIDSLRADVASMETETKEKKKDRDFSAEEALEQPQWRIIVGSYPSRALAQRYIDRARLDTDEMFIVYIEDLNTYRVVYKSFDTLAQAKKELQTARRYVSDAWIIEF